LEGPLLSREDAGGRDARLLHAALRYLGLNNSFYRLPSGEAFSAWRDATPANFVFAVKASRFITPNKKLKKPEHALDNLLPRPVRLGKKPGPVLFQLPPKWRANPERLQGLLALLPSEIRYGFEFRERSSMSAEIFGILREFNAAICIYELAGHHAPVAITADFTYA
jgi:uncharacterized protein YecE (DUF72 family)